MKNEELITRLINIKNDLLEKSEEVAQVFNAEYVEFLDPITERLIDICYELLQEEIEELPENMPDQISEILFLDTDPKTALIMIKDMFN